LTEYYSQVKGQETALNKLTADQYKAARDAFNNNGRNPNSAKEQRQVHKDLEADIAKNLFDQYTTKRGMEPDAALKLAKKDAAKIRKSQKLAALHEPDNIAGGFFGVPEDVGKSNVNSAIGSA
jgi:filamentous hemagglutinin